MAGLLASSRLAMADNESTPNDPFILLLQGLYQPVPAGQGPADNLGLSLTNVNLSDGSYSRTQIYPIFGVDGANDQKKSIGNFYVSSQRIGVPTIFPEVLLRCNLRAELSHCLSPMEAVDSTTKEPLN